MVYMIFSGLGLDANTVDALDADSGKVRWSYRIDGFIYYAPIMANEIMYVVSNNQVNKTSTIYALDAISGKEQWLYQQLSSLSDLTVITGRIYVHSADGNLSVLDTLSGRLIWSEQVGEGTTFFDTPIVVNDIVYFAVSDRATRESAVLALDAASGHKKWFAREATPSIGQLTVANGVVYIATNNASAQISALDAFSGNTLWSSQIKSTNIAAGIIFVPFPFQVVNGSVYIDYTGVDTSGAGRGTNVFYALNARTGHQLWATPTASSEPTIANDLVYVYSPSGNLFALDALSGRKQWSHTAVPFPDQSFPIEPEPVVVNGILYVGTHTVNNTTLYALDAVFGKEQWSYQTGGSFSTLLMVAKGIVYASIDGNLEVIQPPGGAPGFSH